MRSAEERLYNLSIPEPNSGCFLWLGHRNKRGLDYGGFSLGGVKMTAHRAAWIIHNGSVPTGLEIDHICKTPGCVNHAHLRAVTKAQNLSGRRSANALKTNCPAGHPLSGDNLMIQRNGRGKTARRCRACDRAQAMKPKEYQA